MAIMYMRLEGVLQSYADNGNWENRGTAPVPTKSAVMGMLGAAFGYDYGSQEIERLNDNLRMSVRINHGFGKMCDFQTIRAYRVPDRYGMEPPFIHALKDVRKANGSLEFKGLKKNENCYNWMSSAPKLRDKEYLTNASFTVFLEGDANLLSQICDALLHPVYGLYLGRSGCIPTRPILGIMTDCICVQDAWKTCDLEGVVSRCFVEYDFDGNSDVGVEVLTRNDNVRANYCYDRRKVMRKEIVVDVFE